MKTYIAILRGINVSGHKKIKMDALRTSLLKLNFQEIETYIQSGNIVFQYKKTSTIRLANLIAKKILEDFGFEVPVIVKEPDEIESVLKNNPFLNQRKEDVTRLYVTFLSGEPSKAGLSKIKEGDYDEDEFAVFDNVIFLFCPKSYGNTKLNNNFFENKLKVVATTRNWNSVIKLADMAQKSRGE